MWCSRWRRWTIRALVPRKSWRGSDPRRCLLDPQTCCRFRFADFLRDLFKAADRRCDVVVVRQQPTPEDILAAMRAGAKEYLYPPLGATLKEALGRIALAIETGTAVRKAKARTRPGDRLPVGQGRLWRNDTCLPRGAGHRAPQRRRHCLPIWIFTPGWSGF
jgi:hypothetical protein